MGQICSSDTFGWSQIIVNLPIILQKDRKRSSYMVELHILSFILCLHKYQYKDLTECGKFSFPEQGQEQFNRLNILIFLSLCWLLWQRFRSPM